MSFVNHILWFQLLTFNVQSFICSIRLSNPIIAVLYVGSIWINAKLGTDNLLWEDAFYIWLEIF